MCICEIHHLHQCAYAKFIICINVHMPNSYASMCICQIHHMHQCAFAKCIICIMCVCQIHHMHQRAYATLIMCINMQSYASKLHMQHSSYEVFSLKRKKSNSCNSNEMQ